ncbi:MULTISPECIES: nitrate reductase molybdenum cofactor assembly chaperone [unclassified Actinotalea]|uniref:nitrate reductase molybdenum cofactor assembly chaperone n=1 Tax=unclassified Actinotalea TaxID=2638618 RepID=UPI0015F379CE|nr:MULTISPECIES: nitrate reductase molybdenum cofactor assembly chaperone [unclassified Actinotalea]
MNRGQRAATARRVASRETALVHRLAALTLEYPTAELVGLVPTLAGATTELAPRLRAPFEPLLEHLAARDLGDLQAQYVATFDLKRRCSPYLTYFSYGDTRKRGVALVEFKQACRRAGFEVVDDELPDHLCVVLELSSSPHPAAQEEGLRLLLAHRAGLELLRLALLDVGSPWAGALVAVCATLPALGGDEHEAVERLAAQGPPDEEVGLDAYGPVQLPTPGARR